MRTFAALAAALLVSLVACRRDPPPKETLLIAGSSTIQVYLNPLVAAFVKRNPNVSVVSEPGGTTAAIVALKRNAIDVAAINRVPEPSEDDPYLSDYQIGRDAI